VSVLEAKSLGLLHSLKIVLTPPLDKKQIIVDVEHWKKEPRRCIKLFEYNWRSKDQHTQVTMINTKGNKILKWKIWYGYIYKKNNPYQPNVTLSSIVNGSFKIVSKINNNDYKIDLADTFGVSTSFNVVYPSPSFDEGLNIC